MNGKTFVFPQQLGSVLPSRRQFHGPGMSAPPLEACGPTTSYGTILAVDGLTFEVRPGEMFGVIGPNESTKATLFNSVIGQIPQGAGGIRLTGCHASKSSMGLDRLRGGRTSQTLQVCGEKTVRDNLIMAAQEHEGFACDCMIPPTGQSLGDRADTLINKLRICHVAHRKAGELTYIQRKLVNIAMAFISEPTLLLLDELCAGVHPSLVGGISASLKDLNRERNATFIVCGHDAEFITDLCHRILVVAHGKVIAAGTPAEVRADRHVLSHYRGLERLHLH